jgi:cytochrome c-type biogenesis protein CcmH/NrfG
VVQTYTEALSKAKKGDDEELQALNFLAMAYDEADDVKKAIATQSNITYT